MLLVNSLLKTNCARCFRSTFRPSFLQSHLWLSESTYYCWKALGAAQTEQMEELVCPSSTALNVNACSERYGFLPALILSVSVCPPPVDTHFYVYLFRSTELREEQCIPHFAYRETGFSRLKRPTSYMCQSSAGV